MNPVDLTVEEWNAILSIMADRPFREVAALIGKIHAQLRGSNADDKDPKIDD